MSTLRTFNLQHPESSNNNIQLAEGGGVSVTAGILTATNVSSTNVTTTEVTATNGTFSGNLSVGGVLSYEDVTNIDSVGVITARSDVSIADKIVHTGDTDTAIRFPTADTITVETGGSERLRITSDGNLVMNGASPNHDASSGSIFLIPPSGNPNRGIKWSDTSDTHYVKLEPSVIDGLTINGYSGVAFATGSRTNSTWAERLRITSAGDVCIGGHSSNYANSPLEVRGTNAGGDVAIRVTNNSTASGTQAGIIFTTTTADYTTAGIGFERGTDDALKFYVGQSSGGGGFTNATERLRIESNGEIRQQSTGGSTIYELKRADANTTGAVGTINFTASDDHSVASISAMGDGDNEGAHIVFRTTSAAANNSPYNAATVERLRITSAGQMGLGTNDPNAYGGNVKLAVANTSGTCGLSIVSATNGDGNLYYADGTSGDATYRGYIRYNHTLDQFRIGVAGAERLRITQTTASVSSTGSGANGVGCVGIDDNSPDSRALALSIGGGNGVYGLEDSRPLVYLQRSYGIGGGSSTDETTLEVNAPGSYNSAGIVYGIKSRAQHNLNGSHYAGHFEAHGSQYSANGTSALYAKTTKLDTNGSGDVIAFRADASITTGIANNGAAIAGYFASGNNINGKPIVCQNGLTSNNWANQIIFKKHNGSSIVTVGSIKSSNTATQYNTNSDYRLKENVISLTGAIDRLKQLQPKRFNFIGIDETIDGFIAHEVTPIAPYAVSGEKDAVKKELVLDEEGNEQFDEEGEIIEREVIDPQSVDYGKLTTLTIAALQEALAKIETLEAKVAVLEG